MSEHHHEGIDDELHAELHRETDGLGKYALELRMHSDEGLMKAAVRDFTGDLMQASASECFQHGADLIGHIKAFVRSGDQSLLFSMVDERIPIKVQDQIQGTVLRDAELVLHVIVHGIWDDVIRSCVLRVLPGIAEEHGIPYEITADHMPEERHCCH